MKLNYQLEKEKQVQYLNVSGDLIGDEGGPQLVELVSDAIQDECKTFVVNLSGVRYISSSGIGVLITMLTKMRNVGGDVFLTAPSDHVKKLLIITKLNNIFQVFESVQQFKDEHQGET